jgi:oligoendopeptidase F
MKISNIQELENGYQILLNTPLQDHDDLFQWLRKRAEFESTIEEESGWRYIKTTTHTQDQEAQTLFEEFTQVWYPIIAQKSHELNQKLLKFPSVNEYEEPGFKRYFHDIQKSVSLFREENIAIESELRMLGNEYGSIMGSIFIEHEGHHLTLQQAAKLLKENNRSLRHAIYLKLAAARMEKRDELNILLDKMVQLRHQMALNAGFSNYRDYKFEELGRTDYTPLDCETFHNAVEKAIVPINRRFMEERKKVMGLDVLKPWDIKVDPLGRTPLAPFSSSNELIDKTKKVLNRLDQSFASWLETLQSNHRLDLESRPNKAPGGYQYPLPASGIPFIFMNATGTMGDLSTLVHEMGHAVHTQLANHWLTLFQNTPMEVAELASMSMELITMHLWDEFFNPEDLKRAQADQLQDAIGMLPWIAQVDAFQHWMYLHPNHTSSEREAYWQELNQRFGTGLIDHSDIEDYPKIGWQGQLHIYEVPFYYIEYGFAQLGALAVWKNFLQNPMEALAAYKSALSLGNTQSIPDVYQTAGVSFNFSEEYLNHLAQFVMNEYQKIES